MEEYQSTEILEREILEDARKKAQRILKTADETIAEHTAEWNKKIAENTAKIENEYQKQRELAASKVTSRLPIDKLRLKADRIETLINEAVEDWYVNTSRQSITELLTKELSKRLDIIKGIRLPKKKIINFCNIEKNDVITVLKNSGFTDINEAQLEEINSANNYPSIIIDTDNTRIIVSIHDIIDNLLDIKREELVKALAGNNFMENL